MLGFLNLSDTLAAAHVAPGMPCVHCSPHCPLLSHLAFLTEQCLLPRWVTKWRGGVHLQLLKGKVRQVSLFLLVPWGRGTKDLSVSVLSAKAMTQMCLGAVNSGVKFCMLPCDKCGFTTHGKKVKVFPDHIYILGGKNAAFSNPHIPVASVVGLLDEMLGEL